MAAVLLVLPAVNLGFGGLIPHYERWAEVLSGHVDQFQFYAVFNLYPIHDLLTPVMTQVQIGSILALAVCSCSITVNSAGSTFGSDRSAS